MKINRKDSQLDNVQKVTNFGALSSTWDILSILFPPGIAMKMKQRSEEPWVVYVFKETVSSGHKQDWCALKFTETMPRPVQDQI